MAKASWVPPKRPRGDPKNFARVNAIAYAIHKQLWRTLLRRYAEIWASRPRLPKKRRSRAAELRRLENLLVSQVRRPT